MGFFLDRTVERPHYSPPAKRTKGAASIFFPDEILAFGETNSGQTWEKTFNAYQKSFVSQEKRSGRVKNAG
jgi:hypothetical protein